VGDGHDLVDIQSSTSSSGELHASAPAEKDMRKSVVFMSHRVLEYVAAENQKKPGTEAALHEPWFRGTVGAVRQTVYMTTGVAFS
jgi:hypothetical protein